MYAAVSAAYGRLDELAQCGSLTYQIVQLDGSDTLVDSRDDSLRDSRRVNVF